MEKKLIINLIFTVLLPIIIWIINYFKASQKPILKGILYLSMALLFLIFCSSIAILFGYIIDIYGISDNQMAIIIFGFLYFIAIPIYIFRKKLKKIFYSEEGKSKFIFFPDIYNSLSEKEKTFYQEIKNSNKFK